MVLSNHLLSVARRFVDVRNCSIEEKQSYFQTVCVFKLLSLARDESFGNARTARNLFEMTISKQANRIVTLPNINEEVLATIDEADIPTVEELRSSGVRMPPGLDASRP